MKKIYNIFAAACAAVLFVCIHTATAQQQSPTIQWATCYGGSNEEEGGCIIATRDGGYIFCGATYSTDGEVTKSFGGGDFWVVKTDSNGAIQWENSYGGSQFDFATDILQTPEGGYIVSGGTQSNDGEVTGFQGEDDFWVIKLDSLGNLQWEKTYGDSIAIFGSSVAIAPDGYLVFGCAYTSIGGAAEADYLLVKLDLSGKILWNRSYGGSRNDYYGNIRATSDSGFIMIGFSNSSDSDVTGHHGDLSNYDYWVVKIDSLGSIQWENSYGGGGDDYGSDIRQTRDGGYVMCGYSNSTDGDVTGNHGDFDYWVVKIDSVGNLQWQKSLGGSSQDQAYSVLQTSDGGYLVTGESESDNGDVTGHHGNTSSADYWIAKLDSVGNIQWQKSLGGSEGDYGISALQANVNEYIIAGFTETNNDGDVTGNHGVSDNWVVKLDGPPSDTGAITFGNVAVGKCKLDTIYVTNNGTKPDSLDGLLIVGKYASDYSIVEATLRVLQPGQGEDVIINFCPSIGDSENVNLEIIFSPSDTIYHAVTGVGIKTLAISEGPGLPQLSTLSQNYPNPFAGSTSLHVTLAQDDETDAHLFIYNMLGERVADLTNQLTPNGDITFTSGELASGVYYYVLQTASGRWTREMFVVR